VSRDTTLYRKYRPQRLEDIVGQEQVTTTIRNAFLNGNLAHAFLFAGPRGCGKTTTAKILAKLVNCLDPQNGEPCNVCKNCTSADNGSNPDIVEMDAASNRGIENMRDLTSKVDLRPSFGEMRVYIIDEVHMLTTESFNALLKTLEEPPDTVMFILATTEVNKVIGTITSRCQVHSFKRISVKDISGALLGIAAKENIAIDESGSEMIATHSGGSLRDAIGKLQQIKDYAGGGTINSTIVNDYIGVTNSGVLADIFDLILGKDLNALLEFINKVDHEGADIPQLMTDFEEYLRKIWLLSIDTKNSRLFYNSQEELARLEKQAAQLDTSRALMQIEILEDAMAKLLTNAVPRIVLETAFTKMAFPEMDNGAIGIKTKLNKMDNKLNKLEAVLEFFKDNR
jgi:DNA polymerase-3 subunit gamma/tau